MNWKNFELKYDNRETWAFEQISYLLFCAEFNNRIGLFRYKNQTGIETEPFEKSGRFYGFQAKYYTTSIADNKDDIIDSIKKAKSKNTKLTDIYLYINRELSESSTKSKKKPQYQMDIEKYTKSESLEIHWRVPSHFELQLSLPENKYLYDAFFSLEPSGADFLDEIYKHNDNIFKTIKTEIIFGDRIIKIDRNKIVKEIESAIKENKNIVISGEGGCGKTAIFKYFYRSNYNKIPICIFKSNELNVSNINEIFNFENNYTFSQFIDVFKSDPVKLFVIDSAERLAEIVNNEIISELIRKLSEYGWNIIFTTRYSYLNDLVFHIKENYQLPFEVSDVPLITIEELSSISKDAGFLLPTNIKFRERLRNLFYLSEYLKQYINIDKNDNLKCFVDLLWKKRIQNTVVQYNNIHLDREKCIISIVKQRCETGRFYISADDLPQPALFQLRQDEILGYDDSHAGYFITHDIYEEWALDKIVSRYFSNSSNIKQFFCELGSSLPIRRAFRLWLSDHLSHNIKEIERYIYDALLNNEIEQFWKDEILVSVLLSDYSGEFFKALKNEIANNDFFLLKRILFLLRIACTDISAFDNMEIVKPKGRGWEEVISFIYEYQSDFFHENLNLIIPVLTHWCDFIKKGSTTKLSGLLTLSVIKKSETEHAFYIHDDLEESILGVVFNAASELRSELKEIFDKVVANRWIHHRDPYMGLCSKILVKPYIAVELIKTLPLSVIQLCDLFWKKPIKNEDDFGYGRDSMEDRYGLAERGVFNYSPASANHTPIKWLLQVAFSETLDFIISFANQAVETYSECDYGKADVLNVKLYINEKEVNQYLSAAIWSMYRGHGNPVVPYLIQSIHMALEKTLLEFSEILDSKSISSILNRIIVKSKTASLTSVVCSVVLANPDKYYEVALILFKTIELFKFDTIRSSSELHAKSLYSIGYGLDKLSDALYKNERMKTCEDNHRNSNLESLFLNYQFFGVKGLTDEENSEFIDKLYAIIDKHKSDIEKVRYFGILLARMDRRNLEAKISSQGDERILIEFTPKELSEDLRKQSEQVSAEVGDQFKYSSLKIWSDFLIGGMNQDKSQNVEKYNSNPLMALSETRQLVEELRLGRSAMRMFDYFTPAFSCSKLIIQHKKLLSQGDKDFCKEIITLTLSRLFSDDYNYQIGDGTEAAVHAIPALVEDYPDDVETYVFMIILVLLDEVSIGQYKRICDYAIESIRKSKLWISNNRAANSILLGYLKIKPLYKKILSENVKNMGYGARIPKSFIIEELEKKNIDNIFSDIAFDVKDIDSLGIQDLEIIYQLIPSDTSNKYHLDIYIKTLPLLASKLFEDRKIYTDHYDDDSNIYLLRLSIFKNLANFILHREICEVDVFLQPLIECFSSTKETASFIGEFITAQDQLKKFEQFWYVWNKLYPKIHVLHHAPKKHYEKEIIINYLLSWRYWREGIEDWHTLKSDNLSLYENAAKELGHIPSVLYSVARVLNSIGSNFIDDGIDWIHTIVSENSSLELDSLESNTLYYLEKIFRKFIFIKRQKIKEDFRLKNKIVPILDFMIERGSIHGYLLRESIL